METHELGVIRPAPFQMKLKQGREPDLLFLTNGHRDRLRETFLEGPADLVVEIVSPESVGRDRGEKFTEYEARGAGILAVGSRADLEALYGQHTAETGQVFEAGAVEAAWAWTQGQPWLVNALAYETCFRMPEGRERSRPIGVEMMQQARENLILRRETHLDQLADKLREERVRRVIEPLLVGAQAIADLADDDVQYVEDLGLVRRQPQLLLFDRTPEKAWEEKIFRRVENYRGTAIGVWGM